MTRKPKRTRDIRFDLHISQEEYTLIQERMAEVGIRNMSAFIRKMSLNGYIFHVDLSPVKELASLQKRCANNLNQIAANVNTYGGIYPQELMALQRDYAALWKPLSELIKQLPCFFISMDKDFQHICVIFQQGASASANENTRII